MEKALQLPVNYMELGKEEIMQLEGGRRRRRNCPWGNGSNGNRPHRNRPNRHRPNPNCPWR